MVTESFCKLLPKIELHAHLNGSLSENTLRQLGCLSEAVEEYSCICNILKKTERTLDECFNLFKVAHRATSNMENLYIATLNVIKEFYDDRVLYLELRTTPRTEVGMTKKQYIETVVKAIRDNKYDIIVKLLLSIDRRHKEDQSYDSLDIIIEMKNLYPDIIVGVDLCGNPNEGVFDNTLFEKARQNDLKIVLHCAEVKNEAETIEMFNFKPDRIGHGTCIHPESNGSLTLWERYLDIKIPIEACMTSNVVCGTSTSYKDHHVKHWYIKSLPFSLSTDDKGVFCTTLSKEYYKFAKSFNVTEEDLFKVASECIDYTFANREEKDKLRAMFDKYTN